MCAGVDTGGQHRHPAQSPGLNAPCSDTEIESDPRRYEGNGGHVASRDVGSILRSLSRDGTGFHKKSERVKVEARSHDTR